MKLKLLSVASFTATYLQSANTLRISTRSINQPRPIKAEYEQQFAKQSLMVATILSILPLKTLAETGKMGVDSSGLFDLCPDTQVFSNCVSSQDDRPQYFLAPWCYEGKYEYMKDKLLNYLLQTKGASIRKTPENQDDSRYIRVEFQNKDDTYDDAEFYFTPNDNTIQFRSFRRNKAFDWGENRRRIENLRISLNLESVPVLRNRRRVLFFIESPLDEFGPPTVQFDKMVDQISGDMSSSDGVLGVLDPTVPIWETSSTSRK